MRRVFADTFYFLALLNPRDSAHSKAVAFTANNAVELTTTEWVLTELADGLARSPRGRAEFLSTLGDLHADGHVTIIESSHSLFVEGTQLYGVRPDKEWSLTDCISILVMQRAGITEALTGDHHFEQAGFVALLK